MVVVDSRNSWQDHPADAADVLLRAVAVDVADLGLHVEAKDCGYHTVVEEDEVVEGPLS